MNERIRELAKQAAAVEDGCSYEWDSPFTEKLVKMVVQECVKALWTEDCHVSDLAIIDFNEKKRKIYTRLGIEE